jgi:hypothetical protein
MPRLSRFCGAALLILCLAPLTPARASEDSAEELTRRARVECDQGRSATARDVRQEHFTRGQALAERAVALDDQNADAHFEVFCNMGELMRLDGESIRSVFALRRLLAELDRTLELSPDHLDAMSSKGTFLVRLPRMLGGDATKGEAMLREVLRRDPNAVNARLVLAKYVDGRGNRDEAISFATRAMQIARDQGRADRIAACQSTLEELGVVAH